MVPVVIGTAVVALAGLGVGVYAVATTPGKTSGPRGPMGRTGADGAQGPQGVAGAVGAVGPAGPPGTLASTSIVAGAAVTSAADPPVGTTLVAKTSCPTGSILLTGSAQVSAPGLVADRNVALRVSIPLDANIWQTVAAVTGPLGAGTVMTMKPYVVCGVEAKPAAKTTTTTTTTSTVPTT
jgi:hypothetical protein